MHPHSKFANETKPCRAVQLWDRWHKDLDLLEQGQKATEVLQRLEQLCYGDRLGELGLFRLERRKFQGDLRAPPSA